jgi:hypothetical protein
MAEGWPVLYWDREELLRRCGDVDVPVEVSYRGADYRQLYCHAVGDDHQFHAGVLLPLSVLLDNMRRIEEKSTR